MLYKDIDYDKIQSICSRLASCQELPKTINAEIALAFNMESKLHRYSFRELLKQNSLEDLVKFVDDLSHPAHDIKDAYTFFQNTLGEPENPFVRTVMSDFGGLRRARISDGDTIFISTDSFSEPAALTRAILLAVLAQSGRGVNHNGDTN